MVASDTLVGAIGAVVLVVALVGVFVLESGNAADQRDLQLTNPKATGSGHVTQSPAPQNPALPCQPPVNPCPLGPFYIHLNLSGLPHVEAPTALHVWTGQPAHWVGTMVWRNDRYECCIAGSDQTQHTTLFVTFEASTQKPAAPSARIVWEHAISSGPATPIDGTFDAKLGSGTSAATLADTDTGLQIAVSLTGALNHTGLDYTAWARTTDDKATLIGKFSGQGDKVEGSVSNLLVKYKKRDVEEIVVTLEPPAAANSLDGWPVFVALMVTPIDPAPK